MSKSERPHKSNQCRENCKPNGHPRNQKSAAGNRNQQKSEICSRKQKSAAENRNLQQKSEISRNQKSATGNRKQKSEIRNLQQKTETATEKPKSVATISRDSWNKPKRVRGLDHVRVRAAFASGVVSAAIGDDGSLWTWGKSKRGQLGLGNEVVESLKPSKVEAFAGENIVKVSFGWGHALAQTDDGKLYGWGYSGDGRLGSIAHLETSPLELSACIRNQEMSSSTVDAAEKLVLEAMEKEKDMPLIWEPRLMREFNSIKIVEVACGLDHSLVLCGDGTLLSCGSNIYGQLGRPEEDLGMLAVDLGLHPISVASGLGHSLAICRFAKSDVSEFSTSIVTWGWNQSSQLGRAGPSNTPLVVEGLEGETPTSVSGGRVHSIALTASGEVWVWGCGKNGRLGLGSSCDEPEPIVLDCLEGCEVLQVVSGFDHNLVLVAE